MDRDERARLRALCEAATPGPWETYRPAAGGLGIAHGDPRTHHGCIARIVAGEPADAALMGIARTALPALLDALDAAEHALREARAEMERLRAELAEVKRPRLNIYLVDESVIAARNSTDARRIAEDQIGEGGVLTGPLAGSRTVPVRTTTGEVVEMPVGKLIASDVQRGVVTRMGAAHEAFEAIRARGAGGER